jgi:peptidyl-prolyl cis-trans isomerase C
VRPGFLGRAFREPLAQFVLLGITLFAASRFLSPAPGRTPPSRQIVLTLDDLRQLQIGFAAQWQRAPSEQEMVGLLENRIKEEILYREALAMGLDKDDTIVKRRMAQKMEFLAEDVSASHEPTAEELGAWFAKNSKQFTQPARITFRLVYFSPDHRGPRTKEDAEKALPKLAGKPAGWPGAAALGDPFVMADYVADRTPEQVAKDFGPPFARALFEQKRGAWTGPVESGYGWNLVFVDALTPERIPTFEEVEPDVKAAWLAARKADAWDSAYKTMRAKYELVLPAPPAVTPTAKEK